VHVVYSIYASEDAIIITFPIAWEEWGTTAEAPGSEVTFSLPARQRENWASASVWMSYVTAKPQTGGAAKVFFAGLYELTHSRVPLSYVKNSTVSALSNPKVTPRNARLAALTRFALQRLKFVLCLQLYHMLQGELSHQTLRHEDYPSLLYLLAKFKLLTTIMSHKFQP
jgi:hypothetical protein